MSSGAGRRNNRRQENVSEFERDFPGAKRFELNRNYRSSPEIVRAANQLAGLMGLGAAESAHQHGELWTAASNNAVSIGQQPVAVAIGDTDQSEYIRERDEEVCLYCEVYAPNGHVDHRTSRANGGSNDFDNLAWACAPCNWSKGAMNDTDFMSLFN